MIGVGVIGYGLMGKRYVENINKIKEFRIIKILRKMKKVLKQIICLPEPVNLI